MADPHPALSVGRQTGIYPLPYVPGMPLTNLDPGVRDEYRDAVRETAALPVSEPPLLENAPAWRTRQASAQEYDRDARLDMLIGRLRGVRDSNPAEFQQTFGNPSLERRPPQAVKSSILDQGQPLNEGLNWMGSLPSTAVNAYRMAIGVPNADEDLERSVNVLAFRLPQAMSQNEMYPEKTAAQDRRDSIPFHDPRLIYGALPEQIVKAEDRHDGLTSAAQALRESGAPDHWGTTLTGMVLDGLLDVNPVGVQAGVSLGRAMRSPVGRAANLIGAGASAASDLALPALFTGVNEYGRQNQIPR